MQHTNYEAARHRVLLEELYSLSKASNDVWQLAPVAILGMPSAKNQGVKAGKGISIASLVKRATEHFAAAGLDARRLTPLVREYLRSEKLRMEHKESIGSWPDNAAFKELRLAFRKRNEVIIKKLAKIPPSVMKAIGALRADIELGQLAEEYPSAIIALGPEARDDFPEYSRQFRTGLQLAQPLSPPLRAEEGHWLVACARYCEDFEPQIGHDVLLNDVREIESRIRDEASVLCGRASPEGPPEFADGAALFLRSVWMYSRCRTARHVIAPIVRSAIPVLLQWQRADGAWDKGTRRSGHRVSALAADPHSTAAAVLLLSNFGLESQGQHVESRSRAIKWLLSVATNAGGWTDVHAPEKGTDPVVSAVVLEALRRGGVEASHPVIERAEDALLSIQHPTGHWGNEIHSYAFCTELLVEYFRVRDQRGKFPNRYLESARMFLQSSERLASSDDVVDAPLATIAAYHGLEHFLYGCILVLSENESIEQSGGKTIGLRDAMPVFLRCLKTRGLVSESSQLPQQTQIRELATKRDHAVHRASEIRLDEARQHVSCARKFVTQFDLSVLRFRLLD
jgi:hypothetical protein